jgi:DNA mismatch repair protein MutL
VISAPQSAQGQADRMLLYVNQRPVQDKLFLRAVRDAYQGRLLTREYPQVALFLHVPPEEVDVNVHPAKSEVRFRDQQGIFSLVRAAVSQALERAEPRTFSLGPATTEPPEDEASTDRPMDRPANRAFGQYPKGLPDFPDATFSPGGSPTGDVAYSEDPSARNRPKFSTLREYQRLFPTDSLPLSGPVATLEASGDRAETTEPMIRPATVGHSPQPHGPSGPDAAAVHYLGQVLNTYLVLATAEGLLLVDQHAAHERILFQRLRHSARPLPRDLLVPLELPLHPAQQEALEELWATLPEIGFRLENPRPGLLLVRGLPEHMATGAAREFLLDLLNEQPADLDLGHDPDQARGQMQKTDQESDAVRALSRKLDPIWSLMACKSAITAGQELDRSEALHLLDAWLQCPDRSFCPHGRPIAVPLGANELEKLFKRKG